MNIDLQQIQGGQQILAARDVTFACWCSNFSLTIDDPVLCIVHSNRRMWMHRETISRPKQIPLSSLLTEDTETRRAQRYKALLSVSAGTPCFKYFEVASKHPNTCKSAIGKLISYRYAWDPRTIGCRCLFINLLASLNLLEITQLVTGNDTFAFETSSA